MHTQTLPSPWTRQGLILARSKEGPGNSVVGDPCIVWDESLGNWRMFLFYDPPGHAHAICTDPDCSGMNWELAGPLAFTNPDALCGQVTHKPWIVTDARSPNQPAKIDGRFCLVTVSYDRHHKLIQQAWSDSLTGPWELVAEPLIRNGSGGDFDARHVDAVTGFYFPERREILYHYMGYPEEPQGRRISPYGSAQGIAIQKAGETFATKTGEFLPPAQEEGHWASGWVGGFQLLPGRRHRWIAIINASPTAPDPANQEVHREEPPPSLGGFAFCDEEWPVRGWQWHPQPIERIEDVPATALATGEGTNFWRQHALLLPGGATALYYNSGSYGREQLYRKSTDQLEWL